MELKRYLENIDSIEGWCIPELWNCIQPIDTYQRENNINGPIAEIGVYHGKFFIGLALTKYDYNVHCAIDVFDLQKFNLDNAGEGNLKLFKKNLKSYDISNVDIINSDSLSVRDDILDDKKSKYSMVSIDGCHMAEHTINDLEIAMKIVDPAGVIFVDDYYNPNWPGVQEGICKYYLTNIPKYVPFLYTCNKLFLCLLSYHDDYIKCVYKFLRENHPRSRLKKVKRFGYDTLTVIPDHSLSRYII